MEPASDENLALTVYFFSIISPFLNSKYERNIKMSMNEQKLFKFMLQCV